MSSFSEAVSEIIVAKDPMVSVEWLHKNLRNPNIKILDASWYMPHEQRNPLKEYQDAHIPGALFFDIEGIKDINSTLPHMLPSEEAFCAAVSALGIRNNDALLVYDAKGLYSAARVWWMFQIFGHDKIWVIDGGFPRWRALGFNVESASKDVSLNINGPNDAVKRVYQGVGANQSMFKVKFLPNLVWNIEQIEKNIKDPKYQHVDARPKARFDGVAPEPRKGIKSGHIDGSKCIPYSEVLDGSQILLPSSDLAKRFESEDVSLDRPIILSCGTGVTACIVGLGLHRLGKYDVPIFDGSWTEWALKYDLTE